ncbi:MAG: oxidoreductase [Verrucomicrobia bacterium]|nr:MAG: oxidoreductase [Verrucomicrobiota bacterium]
MNSNQIPSESQGESRRSFIRKTAAAAAAVSTVNMFKTPVYGQTQAPASGRVIGANDRISMAYIGTGSRGMQHIEGHATGQGEEKQRKYKEYVQGNNINQAAVCDLFRKRLDHAKDFLKLSEADAYTDHRRLLERKDIDAVLIATIDNWHAQCTIDALEAGKHVYCEKPMTRYLGEAFQVYDTVKRTGKVFCVGSQGCADPKWHKAAEWIKAGKLGPLVWGQGSFCRNNHPKSEWSYPEDPEATPTTLEWERWLGKAKKIPFNREHYFSWHKYYAYNSGILGNLLPHRFYPMMLATGNPEYPRRVACTGTRKVSTDREITDTTHALAEFPSGLTLVMAGSTVNEVGLPDILRGLKATLYFNSSQNKVELKPEKPFTEEMDAIPFEDPLPTERTERLHKNFFDAIRTGIKPFADIELAIRGQVALCLAEMSERMGLTLYYDEKTRQIKTGEGKIIPPISYDSNTPIRI